MIRLSYGTAVKMGLRRGKMLAEPTTAYIMLGERCHSNCSFCTQRRSAPRKDYLSRVLWIPYPVDVLRNIKGFSRICFQTLDYPEVVDDLLEILPILPKIPVSVSIVPVPRESMIALRDAGVDIISIALDAANPDIFERVKGKGVGNRFTWDGHWNALRIARDIFQEVNTHLIVGMGESDEELVSVMRELKEMGITTALFSYTPVQGGTAPDIGRYRAVQLARYIIYRGGGEIVIRDGKIQGFILDSALKQEVRRGVPFLTSGCPGCNRPFYNERPGGVIYNYPRMLTEKEVNVAIEQLLDYATFL